MLLLRDLAVHVVISVERSSLAVSVAVVVVIISVIPIVIRPSTRRGPRTQSIAHEQTQPAAARAGARDGGAGIARALLLRTLLRVTLLLLITLLLLRITLLLLLRVPLLITLLRLLGTLLVALLLLLLVTLLLRLVTLLLLVVALLRLYHVAPHGLRLVALLLVARRLDDVAPDGLHGGAPRDGRVLLCLWRRQASRSAKVLHLRFRDGVGLGADEDAQPERSRGVVAAVAVLERKVSGDARVD
mmetsp:Transcript_10351/g.36471  ORF Transcript_10351/g.36471 Transcript_10351/m.36471 type:complete len:244 (+) Transcript_10351:1952-2683(+)